MPTIVSLFSGAGGLDLGFHGGFSFLNQHYAKHNFTTLFACDIEKNACLTYEHNFRHTPFSGDIWEGINTGIIPSQADVVLGGFPCQPFSYAGKRQGFEDSRGLLYTAMLKVISLTQPKIFIAENVKGILDIEQGQAIKAIVHDFTALGYNVNYHVYQAADFGVPQSRSRVIIVGLKQTVYPDTFFKHLAPTCLQHITAQEALHDLATLSEDKLINHVWSKAKRSKGQGNTNIAADKIAPAMRAEHHGNIEFLWDGSRRLSAREAARLQSFPDDFIFLPSTSAAYKQIGNAVPPVFAWHIARQVLEYLK